ncbi:hypothetical protein [Streptomyces sp. NPDC053431]|uniref:hypothetical protein n=1 Tax=Streptomyces sp. NPDC053431 TaxID=3365703 RepID=UPI0037D4CBCC
MAASAFPPIGATAPTGAVVPTRAAAPIRAVAVPDGDGGTRRAAGPIASAEVAA